MRSLALAAVLLAAAAPASAHEAKKGDMVVNHPILRASLGKSPNTAGYLTLQNKGKTADRLVSASCACAAKVEVHGMKSEAGRMVMRPAGPVAIPAGGQVAFRPGGLHLMVTGLKAPLEAGTLVPMTLTFEKAGAVQAPFFATARVEEELKAHGAGAAQSHHRH
jgi:hypothetical protein